MFRYFFLFFCIYIISSCKKKDTLFELISADKTGVAFNNIITENDSLNILDYEYIYNGGGVAIADFDNDGLQDLYFTGNMVENKMYRNLGNMKFEDVTKISGTDAKHFWCSGVTIVDLNQDGKKDIYISTNTYSQKSRRMNLLFINESSGPGQFKFVEKAEQYGIADTTFCMNSIFFDYDNDLDLDLLVITNKAQKRNDVSVYTRGRDDVKSGNVEVLYRNDFDSIKGHAFFTNVSEEAGIKYEGFSLGVNVCDINEDGWKDIYISNDFISNDLLYINNKNGTFTNRLDEYLSHTCMSAMGNEVADINNDGLQDIIALDMLPEDNYRRKTMMPSNNYSSYVNNKDFGYTHQFTRNVLQINRGFIPELGHNIFSDIACFAEIEATDWSWTPLVNDFDYDGYKDIIITNGFPKDVTDKDFMDYKASNIAFIDKKEILKKIPEVKLKNYAFRNKGNGSFENNTDSWGIEVPSYSNGAAYADLDNDGDIDYVVNNINDICHVFKNKANEKKEKNNFIKLQLQFQKPNIEATGSIIKYYFGKEKSVVEFNTSRGYLSSMEPTSFLGIGKEKSCNLEITWPNGKTTFHQLTKINDLIKIVYDEKDVKSSSDINNLANEQIFEIDNNIPQDTFLDRDYIDFNFDPLILTKKSNKVAAIAVGDVNNDKLDDFYVSSGASKSGKLYIQQKKGSFLGKIINLPNHLEKEQTAAAFIDLDKDGDKDLYIVCGSNQFNKLDPKLEDIILINDNGSFADKGIKSPIPPINASCITVADYDKDGDEDIFIGGESMPYFYPMHEASYLIKNEGDGEVKLVLEGKNVFKNLGLVTDSKFMDYNGDGQLDIVSTTEWGSLKFLKNMENSFTIDNSLSTDKIKGWFNCLESGDLDKDGDLDIVVGNMGTNTIIKSTLNHPTKIYSKDFDGNSSYDFIISTFFKNKKGNLEETSYHNKGDVIKEFNGFRKKFTSHVAFSNAPMDSILPPKWRENMLSFEVNEARSGIFINNGKDNFTFQALPNEAQFSSINGMTIYDINNDGKNDIISTGNNYGYELTNGRLDASIGCVFINNGGLKFQYLPPSKSGIYFSNDGRKLELINTSTGKSLIHTSNNSTIKGYKLKTMKEIQ